MKHLSRRNFIKAAACGGAGLVIVPNIIRSSLYAATAPNSRIQVAQIGCGRMGSSDMAGTMGHSDLCRMVAVCDLDSKRLEIARGHVEEFYKKKGESGVTVQAFHDYKELLARPDIDAVIVSLPDHQHGLVAVAAILAGKDVYVQKPMTYSIAEAIALRTAVRAKNRILQTGSQQRSQSPWGAFRAASEAVRNGRVGNLRQVKIGIGLDRPKGKKPAPEPVPSNLDFERWLGPAPEQAYIEARVHPQDKVSGRPGWITTEDFGIGMITNWGAHHIDIAHWAMGMELGGPIEVDGKAEFMQDDVWTVHGKYHIEMLYPNHVQVVLDNSFNNGIRFEGDEGWVFCARGSEKVTSSDPNVTEGKVKSLDASDPKVLAPLDRSTAKVWMPSGNHYRNWLESIVSRKDPIAPVDQAARSLEACAAAWISMKLKRKLAWNSEKEEFTADAEANAMRSRKARKPEYDIDLVMKNAGLV